MKLRTAYPFVRYVLFLITGILAAMHAPFKTHFHWHIVFAVALAIAVCFLVRHKIPRFRLVEGVLGAALLFTFGIALTREKQESAQINKLPETEAYWLIEAESEGKETPKTIKLEAKVLALKDKGSWQKSGGKVILYIRKGEDLPEFRYGASYIIKARLMPVPEPLNPSVFNYSAYMAAKGVGYQSFIGAGDILRTNKEPRFSLVAEAVTLRNRAAATIQRWVEGQQEKAIIQTLVLGARETLDEEIKQAYATAGVMHVLAVSGLHVGFIFGFLNFLFSLGQRNPFIRWGSFVMIVLALWSYALMAGLSPSVIRAAWMFTMLDLALKMKRKSGTYNTLAVAAFALLVRNPYNLSAVGFQLSFLAVAGIVYLGSRLNSLYSGKNIIIRYFWGLLAVSIAAQLATFPLGLYYFGQFPAYFFVTNLLVVPAAGLILGLGFLLLFSSLISNWLAAGVGWLLNSLMKSVNTFVFFAESLPFSKLNASINEFQLFLLSGIIAGILLLFHFRKFGYAVFFFLFAGLLTGNLIYTSRERKEQKKLIVYHIPAYTAVQLIDGDKEFFLKDEQLPPDQLKFQVQPHRAALGFSAAGDYGIGETSFQPAIFRGEGYTLVVWRGVSLLLIDDKFRKVCGAGEPVIVDYMLVSRGSIKNWKEISTCFQAKKILIDGSTRDYLAKNFQQRAEGLNLDYHITAEKGAFMLDLNP